jgi:hypothetical protein
MNYCSSFYARRENYVILFNGVKIELHRSNAATALFRFAVEPGLSILIMRRSSRVRLLFHRHDYS